MVMIRVQSPLPTNASMCSSKLEKTDYVILVACVFFIFYSCARARLRAHLLSNQMPPPSWLILLRRSTTLSPLHRGIRICTAILEGHPVDIALLSRRIIQLAHTEGQAHAQCKRRLKCRAERGMGDRAALGLKYGLAPMARRFADG